MGNITIGEIGGAIAFLVGLVGGLLTLLRHAKNGLKEMLKGEFEGVNDNFISVRREIHEVREIGENNARNGKRNEILLMVNVQPEKVDDIERAYEEYKSLGGNGYVDSLIEAWREEYERDLIKARIKRKENNGQSN